MTIEKDVFTTFEVGRFCKVYHTTVINWINKGQLKAYTTPGKHRRIQKNDLVAFMRKFNIRIPRELGGGRPRILVVDDDPNILKLVQRSLLKFMDDADVVTIENGVEALVSVGKQVPDLIVLDVIMPGMDGINVCKTLRAAPETEGIKIIAITGKNLSDEQEGFLRQNVEEIFKKPFSPAKLAEAAANALKIPS